MCVCVCRRLTVLDLAMEPLPYSKVVLIENQSSKVKEKEVDWLSYKILVHVLSL